MQSKKEVHQEPLLTDLKDFWNFCKALHGEDTLDESLENLEKESIGLHANVDIFRNLVLGTPLCSVIQQWLSKEITSAFGQEIIEAFETFYKNQIFPLKGSSGHIFNVDDLRALGHSEIIERIRCIPALRLGERENMINVYMHFAKFLSHLTFGSVPLAIDPDREKTKKRILPLERFWSFCLHLSERDSLVASIMYYTGYQLNDVLNLKVGDIQSKIDTILFNTMVVQIPRHTILRLRSFLLDKNECDLLFTNRKGEDVNRSHVLLAFRRASKKIGCSDNDIITPRSLIIASSY